MFGMFMPIHLPNESGRILGIFIKEGKTDLAKKLLVIIIALVVIMIGLLYFFFSPDFLTVMEYSFIFALVMYYFLMGVFDCYKIRTFKHHFAYRVIFFVVSCIFLLYTIAINIMEGFHFDGQLIPLQGELFLMLVPIQCLANGIRANCNKNKKKLQIKL